MMQPSMSIYNTPRWLSATKAKENKQCSSYRPAMDRGVHHR